MLTLTVLTRKQIGVIQLLTGPTVAVEDLDEFGPGKGEEGGVAVGFVDGGESGGGVVAGDGVVDLADRYFEGIVLGCEGGGGLA